MSTPNPDFFPEVNAINGQPIYFDGWETTLSADWDGTGVPPLADWITLNNALLNRQYSSAHITVEWSDGGQTFRRKFILYCPKAGKIASRPAPDMATAAQVPWATMPAGSRVYMPMFSADLQMLMNTAPTCLPYVINGDQWVPVLGWSPTIKNADGSTFTFPVIDDTTTATSLVLLCYRTGFFYVVLQCTLLGGDMPWFDLPPGSNGGGSSGTVS